MIAHEFWIDDTDGCCARRSVDSAIYISSFTLQAVCTLVRSKAPVLQVNVAESQAVDVLARQSFVSACRRTFEPTVVYRNCARACRRRCACRRCGNVLVVIWTAAIVSSICNCCCRSYRRRSHASTPSVFLITFLSTSAVPLAKSNCFKYTRTALKFAHFSRTQIAFRNSCRHSSC